MNGDNGQAQPQAGGSVLSSFNSWKASVPFVTRSVLLAVSVLGLLALFGLDFGDYLANQPVYTLYSFEIYRLVFSLFVDNSIISVVFMWLFFPAMGARMEQQQGSAPFAWTLLSSALAINLGFLFVCLTLAIFGMSSAMYYVCSGFWSILFTLITLDCLATPDMPRRLLCIPVDIPGMYFPFAIYAFFCLFGGFKLDLLLGIGVGFGFEKGYLDRIKPTEGYIESMEATEGNMLYTAARSNEGYIFAANASYEALNQSEQGQAQGGASQMGSVPGFSNVGGFSGATATDVTPVAEAEAFPGSGTKLSSGSGGPMNKQDVQAKRLAALQSQQREDL